MTKRTVLVLALAATTGVPALAACSTAERQAPLPPRADGQSLGAPSSSSSLGSAPTATIGGGSGGTLSADGRAVPTSGTVGANVTPGPSDGAGLTTRPGYVPGPAGTSTVLADGYRVGVRAPWGILLDDRPAPAPLSIPDVSPSGGLLVDGGRHGSGNPGGSTDAPAPISTGDGPVILAAAAPASSDGFVPPGQAKKEPAAPVDVAAPVSTISFPALLAVLPPAVPAPTVGDAGDPGQGATDGTPPPAFSADEGENPGHAKGAEGTPADPPVKAGTVAPTPTGTPSAVAGTTTAAPLKPAGPTAAPTPSHTPSPASHPEPGPAAPVATGWHIDGLSLSAPAPAASGKGGSAAFRKALRTSLQQRPETARPGSAALRRWSASLQRAASLAPDGSTKQQLRVLAAYANDLASTPAAKRAALQSRHHAALDAASALRAALPRRFGVDLLG